MHIQNMHAGHSCSRKYHAHMACFPERGSQSAPNGLCGPLRAAGSAAEGPQQWVQLQDMQARTAAAQSIMAPILHRFDLWQSLTCKPRAQGQSMAAHCGLMAVQRNGSGCGCSCRMRRQRQARAHHRRTVPSALALTTSAALSAPARSGRSRPLHPCTAQHK